MNQVTVSYEEKNIKQGGLRVNEFVVMFGYDWTRKVFQVAQLANDWNQSNCLMFEARSLNHPVVKIKNHPYKLVKC